MCLVEHQQHQDIPFADIGSQHDMVLLLMTFKPKLKRNKRNTPHIRFNVERLKYAELAVATCMAHVCCRIAELNPSKVNIILL